jgi:short-subunit dehydrogenase
MKKDWVQDKVVVITGGAGGIGTALAWQFGMAGAKIGLIDIDSEKVETRAKELLAGGVKALAQKADLTNQSEAYEAINNIINHFGGIDILINNAGISHRGSFQEAEITTIRKVMEVNFFGALTCTKAALPTIRQRQGMIIVISSIAGIAPLLGRTAYCASKHALHGLFETLRGELQEHGVHVLIACPGFTKTQFQKKALNGQGQICPQPRTMVGSEASPAQVALAIFKAAKNKKRLIVLSFAGKLSYLLFRFVPFLYERLMTKRLAKEIQNLRRNI